MDPCCGTGSFLEQMCLSSERLNCKPTIIGFEILPAPYALAHYRISMISQKNNSNVRIVLTNTLSDDLEKKPDKLQSGMLQQEQQEARELSKPPLTLIIGNPPSSDSFHASSGPNFSLIQNLLNDFRPPTTLRKGRQNIQKQVQNEHMKFLRWSANKILESKRGIISLVLPLSFLDSASYKYARKWLFQNLGSIYILEIDRDARSGVRASSIFNTLQGRTLLVATKLKEVKPKREWVFHYYSISDKDKKAKLRYLSKFTKAPEKAFASFTHYEASNETACLRPVADSHSKRYSKYWTLFQTGDSDNYIFQRHCSGLKLAPSSLFVHSANEMLQRRSQDIGNMKISQDTILRNWYTGQDKPPSKTKLSDTVRTEFNKMAKGTQPDRYSFRPFLTIWSMISEDVLKTLSRTGGGGTRYRPEVLSAYQKQSTIGFVVAPSRRDIGERLHRFTSFCWNLPDNDLCLRGNAHVFCNQFPVYKKKRQWDSQPINNVNPRILKEINVKAEDVVFYSYAILCSTVFLDEFEGALYTGSDTETQPRLPIVKDRKQFTKIVKLGRILAELERPLNPDDIKLSEWTSLLFQEIEDDFCLHHFEIDSGEEAISLIDEHSRIILELKPIPIDVLEYQIGGYSVIQQWLKFFSYRYTRMSFTNKELMLLLGTLQNIKRQHEVIADIDQHVQDILK